MKWLNELIGGILTSAGLDIGGRWGGSIQFFIYDVIKITFLLCFLIFLISYIQSYFPPERSKKIMIEIIASATIATKIGAGGLGDIIVTGLGLNRTDLLLIGGISVALLSISAGILFELLDRVLMKYKFVRV